MRLMVMNKILATKIRGSFRHHKGREASRLDPVKVEAGMYVLNFNAIKRIRTRLKDSKYAEIIKDNMTKFTVGDGSNLDVKYQNYLNLLITN